MSTSNEFNDRFAEDHPYPILRIESNGLISYANPASLPVLLEWGIDVGDPITPEIQIIVDRVLRESIAEKIEVQHGHTFIELIFSLNRTAKAINVFGNDITLQKIAEKEILSAKESAIQVAKLKADFLTNMSHEIRTPMNGIIGMCTLLLSTPINNEQRSNIEIIQNCGNSLLDLINNILDFSKLEVGKITLENAPFQIHESINEIIKLLGPKFAEKNITCNYVQDASIPDWVSGDVTRFRQVLTNLIGNALKFTEQGSVTVVATAQKEADENYRILIEIQDTGIGIDEDSIKNLFQSFSQADLSTTRKYGGSGLGLSISKGLCEQMGGSIDVQSKLGVGSVFTFNVVVAFSDPPGQKSILNTSTYINNNLAKQKHLSILIVEDNYVNQLVIAGLLKKFGYSVDIASNGLDALDCIKKKPYDIIFMDCHMPEMDGFEATRNIRKLYPDHPNLKIIALTASNTKYDRDRCLESGMNDFISKPVVVKEILRVLLDH